MKNSSPNSISHKELNILFKKALKDTTEINSQENITNPEIEEFNKLTSSWSEKSHQILLMLKKKEELLTKDKSSKSLMALGAMGAHINMALQAFKAVESD